MIQPRVDRRAHRRRRAFVKVQRDAAPGQDEAFAKAAVRDRHKQPPRWQRPAQAAHFGERLMR